MFVVCVEFTLKPGCSPDFLPLMHQQADKSLKLEEGCLRFDVLAQSDNDDVIFLYEIYSSKAAFDLHLTSSHFLQFDKQTADLVAAKTVTLYDQLYSPGQG